MSGPAQASAANNIVYTREIADRVAAIYRLQMMPYRRGAVVIEVRTCMFGRDGEIRTRGLLLPKQAR